MNTEKIRARARKRIADAVGVPEERIRVQIKRIDYENDFMLEPTFSVNAHMLDFTGEGIGYIVSSSTLVQVPGCCGLCLSTGATVKEELRGLGIGSIMSELRIEVAKLAGFSAIMCTDVKTNTPQQAILAKMGYERIFEFNNTKTGNDIQIHIKRF